MPVFTLEAQEGRLFSPLAYTKTYAMAAAAGLVGHAGAGADGLPDPRAHPRESSATRSTAWLIALYRPLLSACSRFPKATLVVAVAGAARDRRIPSMRLGGEFMPPLDEGDLLYMPSALPGISAGKASELLQQTDRLIKTVPEVASVFGKAGRAETATDPAPLEMFETTIQFKPRDQWRAGHDAGQADRGARSHRQVPGLVERLGSADPQPHRHACHRHQEPGRHEGRRHGPRARSIASPRRSKRVVKPCRGVTSALAERLTGGRYIDVNIDRDAAARYGLNIADVQSVVSAAIGGENIGETVEGLQRFPINVRYPREMRDSRAETARPADRHRARRADPLGDVATIRISDGRRCCRAKTRGSPAGSSSTCTAAICSSAVREMQEAVASEVKLPPGYSISWSGQFEYLERATGRLKVVVPVTLAIIFLLLYLTFRRLARRC